MSNTYEYYYTKIKDLDIGAKKAERAFLNSKLKTTELMTRLYHRRYNGQIDRFCKDPIDVLYLWVENYSHRILLITYLDKEVRKSICEMDDGKNRYYTFTEMKKKGNAFWWNLTFDEPGCELKLSNGVAMNLWKEPYYIRAVTEYDRAFGNYYCDGIEYSGNYYGDTTTFCVIGNVI